MPAEPIKKIVLFAGSDAGFIISEGLHLTFTINYVPITLPEIISIQNVS